jgi:hypothetical protein
MNQLLYQLSYAGKLSTPDSLRQLRNRWSQYQPSEDRVYFSVISVALYAREIFRQIRNRNRVILREKQMAIIWHLFVAQLCINLPPLLSTPTGGVNNEIRVV